MRHQPLINLLSRLFLAIFICLSFTRQMRGQEGEVTGQLYNDYCDAQTHQHASFAIEYGIYVNRSGDRSTYYSSSPCNDTGDYFYGNRLTVDNGMWDQRFYYDWYSQDPDVGEHRISWGSQTTFLEVTYCTECHKAVYVRKIW
jgi:hypothetical protein